MNSEDIYNDWKNQKSRVEVGENLTVTGVMKDIPEFSTININALCSFSSLYTKELPPIFTPPISFNFTSAICLLNLI